MKLSILKIFFILSFLLIGSSCSKLSPKKVVEKSSVDAHLIAYQDRVSKITSTTFNKYMHEVETKPYFIKNKKNPAISCRIFQTKPKQKLAFNHNNIVTCVESVPDEFMPFLVNKLLTHRPKVSTDTLTSIIEIISQGNAQHTQSIKSLIEAGALTENINLDYIRWGNTRICESLEAVLKNNKKFYQSVLKTKSKSFQKEALHNLAASGMEINLCNNAIRLLASYNPELLNYQSGFYGIPLIAYLNDSGWDEWDITIAKALMTKKNINMQSKNNVTPMQHALMSPPYARRTDQIILKAGLALGADFTLKRKPYSTVLQKKKVNVNELILTTRPKLLGLVKNGKTLHVCFKNFYLKLDEILSPKEKQLLKKSYLYSNLRVDWLEKKIIKALPLPSKNSCIKEYFKVIDEQDTYIMASRVIEAYKMDLVNPASR